jgi:hypothetical protein
MKNIFLLILIAFSCSLSAQSINLEGAWQSGSDENHFAMIVAGNYFSGAVYNKKITATSVRLAARGALKKINLLQYHEYNTMHPEWIGTEQKSEVTLKKQTNFQNERQNRRIHSLG